MWPRLIPRRRAETDATAWRPDALPSGTRLGSLCLDRPLARGASATLYLAHESGSGQTLAVKVLCPQGDSMAECARFLQDGERASRLQHPNIVRVFGGGQVRGIAFLVMELLPGADLTRWTSPRHRLPEAAALDIAAQLADALGHAHRQGVVHRDVKPANAIYDPAPRRAVLIDFGLARAPDAQATRSGMMLGSPAYMAPELLAGAVPDARSDLYALGILCYALLAGRPPFVADRLGAMLEAVAAQAPPRLSSLRPDLTNAAALDALLAPLLAKAPAERASDARQWAAQARLEAQWLTAPPAA